MPPTTRQLIIDSHAHVFNATDLSTEGFIEMVHSNFGEKKLTRWIGDVIQAVGKVGPCATEESDFLDDMQQPASAISERTDTPLSRTFAVHGATRVADEYIDTLTANLTGIYENDEGRRPLPLHVRSGEEADVRDSEVRRKDILEDLKEACLEVRDALEKDSIAVFGVSESAQPFGLLKKLKQLAFKGASAVKDIIKGAVLIARDLTVSAITKITSRGRAFIRWAKWALRFLQFRTEITAELIYTYPDVDLFTPAMVDFEYWLRKDTPASPISDQINVMEKVMVHYGGRVHAYVPFCPARHAFAVKRGDHETPLDWVKNAVEEQGFIGVKIYPPMGFRLMGNASSNLVAYGEEMTDIPLPDDWSDFDESVKPSDLDDALLDLYMWCGEHQVPIIAHCAPSNHARGGSGDHRLSDSPAHPTYWKDAMAKVNEVNEANGTDFPPPPINFAHFGGVESKTAEDCRRQRPTFWPGRIGRMMEDHPDMLIFADLSDHNQLHQTDEQNRLRDFLQCFVHHYGGSHRRLMYGSDWQMLARSRGWKEYLNDFRAVVGPLTEEALFLGLNAADYFGLRRLQPGRRRLDAFYKKHDLPAPNWTRMVDDRLDPLPV